MLEVRGLEKTYTRGVLSRTPTFSLTADFAIEQPAVVGLMGPNGSGKTTLFELITGSNTPTAGEVRVSGRNIHKVRTDERDRLAIHYHQSYQVRHFHSFVAERADGAGGEQLSDRASLRRTAIQHAGRLYRLHARLLRAAAQARAAGLPLRPSERDFHLEILQDICERFIFVNNGQLAHFGSYGRAHPP